MRLETDAAAAWRYLIAVSAPGEAALRVRPRRGRGPVQVDETREGPFADKLNNHPKYVVSTTPKDPAWQNTTVISGDVVARISALEDEIDGVILVAGSGTL